MKLKALLLCSLAALSATAQQRYLGGDISLLPEYGSSIYKDHSGTVVEPLALFKSEGMNTMRVRLFVDPSRYTGSDKDANACQDLSYVASLGKRIKDAGFRLMLDFHYSDTWADPAKQWTPADWASLTDSQLYTQIYDYTRSALQTLKAAGAEPDLIATGNEISYGMLWGKSTDAESALRKCYASSTANWDRFLTLLRQAGKACREECPDAKIILHTERVAQPAVLTAFHDKMASLDYDVIGLSYYPFFHGQLPKLEAALAALEAKSYGKEIMIVEAGYPYAWAVPGTTISYTDTYPYSDEGQRAFTAALVELLNGHPSVTGLFWWWPEYNAYGAGLSGWYNAPLFDSRTGCACSALSELKAFLGRDSALGSVEPDPEQLGPERWFTIDGRSIDRPASPGLYIRNGEKIVVR